MVNIHYLIKDVFMQLNFVTIFPLVCVSGHSMVNILKIYNYITPHTVQKLASNTLHVILKKRKFVHTHVAPLLQKGFLKNYVTCYKKT